MEDTQLIFYNIRAKNGSNEKREHLSFDEQITRLKKHGMKITDKEWAKEKLQQYGYDEMINGVKPLFFHDGWNNITIEFIVKWWQLNKKISDIIFTEIISIEKKIRTQWKTACGDKLGKNIFVDINILNEKIGKKNNTWPYNQYSYKKPKSKITEKKLMVYEVINRFTLGEMIHNIFLTDDQTLKIKGLYQSKLHPFVKEINDIVLTQVANYLKINKNNINNISNNAKIKLFTTLKAIQEIRNLIAHGKNILVKRGGALKSTKQLKYADFKMHSNDSNTNKTLVDIFLIILYKHNKDDYLLVKTRIEYAWEEWRHQNKQILPKGPNLKKKYICSLE